MHNKEQINVFNYDVFISYKSQQESWAKRLAETLRSFGLKVWRDHDAGDDGIRVSEVWTDEVRNGIRASRAMIVLWSNLIKADATSVVHNEVNEMTKLLADDKTGQRRFVPINIDNTPLEKYTALSSFQADTGFQSVYKRYGDGGAYQISPIEWYGAVKTLVELLGIRDVMEVRFVVAAMSHAQAQQLCDDPAKYAVKPDAFQLMCNMMAVTSPFSLDRYGDTPDDWRPFPQLKDALTIKDIVNVYDTEKREDARSRGQYAKWIVVSYSKEIVADDSLTRQGARNAIEAGPCLVIVDPVSLMHKTVFNHIITNATLHSHREAFVIGIAPFVALMHVDLYNTTLQIDEELEQYLEVAYNRFKKPFVPGNRACVMNVEHEFQFMRWLQVAADSIVIASKTPMGPRGAAPHPSRLQRVRQLATKQPGAEVINMGVAGGVTR